MVGIGLAVKGIHNRFDVLVSQHIVVGLFLEEPAGIDELRFGVGFMFGQHQDIHRDGGAEEEVGRQGDHGLHIVVVDQVLTDLLLGPAAIEDAGEADDGGAAFAGEITQRMQHKSEIGLGFGSQHAGGGEALIVDQRGVFITLPLHRIGRIGDDGIERLFVAEVRFEQGVAQLHVELVVVDVVQEHVHTGQVVGGVVDLLAKEAFLDDVGVEMFLGLQKQRAGTAGRVVDFVDAGLLVHGQSGDQARDMLRGEELAA